MGGQGLDKLDKVFYVEYKGPGASTKDRVPWTRLINSSTEAEPSLKS